MLDDKPLVFFLTWDVTGVNVSLNRILLPSVIFLGAHCCSVFIRNCGWNAGQKMLSFTAMFALGPDFL